MSSAGYAEHIKQVMLVGTAEVMWSGGVDPEGNAAGGRDCSTDG